MMLTHSVEENSLLLYSNSPIEKPNKEKTTKTKTSKTNKTNNTNKKLLAKIEETETELRQAKEDGKSDAYITALQEKENALRQEKNILLQRNGKEYIAFISCHLSRVCSVPEVSSDEEKKSNEDEVHTLYKPAHKSKSKSGRKRKPVSKSNYYYYFYY
jgi:hypothetical protein